MKPADFHIINGGSLYLVEPHSVAARDWLVATAPADALFWGESLAVEPRYIEGVVAAIFTACALERGDES
jgi:hypothetical protein